MRQTQMSTDGHNSTVHRHSTGFGRETAHIIEDVVLVKGDRMESYGDDAAMDESRGDAYYEEGGSMQVDSEDADDARGRRRTGSIHQPARGQHRNSEVLVDGGEELLLMEEDTLEDVRLGDSSNSDDFSTKESVYQPDVKRNGDHALGRMSYLTMARDADEDVTTSYQSELQQGLSTPGRDSSHQYVIDEHGLEGQSRVIGTQLPARASATSGNTQKNSGDRGNSAINRAIALPVPRAKNSSNTNDVLGRHAFSESIIITPGCTDDEEITVEVRDKRSVSHIPLTLTIEERVSSQHSAELLFARTPDNARPTTVHGSTIQESPADARRHVATMPLHHANGRSQMSRPSTSPWSFIDPRNTQNRSGQPPIPYSPSEQRVPTPSPHGRHSATVRDRSNSAPPQRASSIMSPQRHSTLIAPARISSSSSAHEIPCSQGTSARAPEWDTALARQWDSESMQRQEQRVSVRSLKGAMVGDQPRSPSHVREPPQPHVEAFRDTIRSTQKAQAGPPAPVLGSTTGSGFVPRRTTATISRHWGTRSDPLQAQVVASTTRSAGYDKVRNSSPSPVVVYGTLANPEEAHPSSTSRGDSVRGASPSKRKSSAGAEQRKITGRKQSRNETRNRSVSEARKHAGSSRQNDSQQQLQQRLRASASEDGANAERSPQRASAKQKLSRSTEKSTREQRPSHEGNGRSEGAAVAAAHTPSNEGGKRNSGHGTSTAASKRYEAHSSLSSQPNTLQHAPPDDDAVVNAATRETTPVYFPGGDTALRGSMLSIGGASGKMASRAGRTTVTGADAVASRAGRRAATSAAWAGGRKAARTSTELPSATNSALIEYGGHGKSKSSVRRQLSNNTPASSTWPATTTEDNNAWPTAPSTKNSGHEKSMSSAQQQFSNNTAASSTWPTTTTADNNAWPTAPPTRNIGREASTSSTSGAFRTKNILLEERHADTADIPTGEFVDTDTKARTQQLPRVRGPSEGAPLKKKKHPSPDRPSKRSSLASRRREEGGYQEDSRRAGEKGGENTQAVASAVNTEGNAAASQEVDEGIGMTEWEREMMKIVRDSQRWRVGFDSSAALESSGMLVEQPAIKHVKDAG
eukprot:GEMP01002774.1.p1 GENE.GEMP01002774.1~~GEMP01002774.1.p1  ORF type:complete len:1235 (+),score=320.87 GEMP01002774.1:430-3705(+)